MFYFLEDFDIASHAGDTTPYCAGKSVEFVVNNLEQSSTTLFEWLNNNYMEVNTGKSHLLLSGNSRLRLRLIVVILKRKMNKYY